MADKAPKFARTPLSDLSGTWHLWGVVAIRCQAVDSGARNAPPSGDGWLPPNRSHPLPSGGQRPEKRPYRLATGGYPRRVATAQTGGYRPGLQLTHSVRIVNFDA